MYTAPPTFVAGVGLTAAQLNAITLAMKSPPHFKGSYTTATAITAATTIPFPMVEDTESGYAAGTYTVKVAGVYRIVYMGRAGSSAVANQSVLGYRNAANLAVSGTASVAAFGPFPFFYWEQRCAINDTLSLQLNTGFTPAAYAADSNVLTIDWLRA